LTLKFFYKSLDKQWKGIFIEVVEHITGFEDTNWLVSWKTILPAILKVPDFLLKIIYFKNTLILKISPTQSQPPKSIRISLYQLSSYKTLFEASKGYKFAL
jgi:hypothetical protein